MQADKIPNEIMREARRCYDKLGTGSIADSERIARALMARDKRAAEIARKAVIRAETAEAERDRLREALREADERFEEIGLLWLVAT